MTGPRRLGTEESETRTLLLDATEQLMLDEGYAAVSTRQAAARANVRPGLVHYYFRTLDDLFLAVFRRGAEANEKRLKQALASENPLRGVWDFGSEPRGTALMIEFMALANHRKVIRSALAEYAQRFRRLQADALSRALSDHGIDTGKFSPAAVTVLMAGTSRLLVMESLLGITVGHKETLSISDMWLRWFDAADDPPGT